MSICGASGVTIYEDDLVYAAQQGIIDTKEEKSLWPLLQNRSDERWKMGWVNLGYFFGGMLIVGSMTWLTNQAWLDTQGLALFYLSSAYVGIFGYAGYFCWDGKAPVSIPQIVGGVFALAAVFISPIPVWSLQRYFNYWTDNTPEILEWSALFTTGGIAIYFVNFPLITFPICLALFGISEQDLAPLIFKDPTEKQYDWISVIFGMAMIIGSISLDKYQQIRQTKTDYAFWGYLYGVLAFCGGLSHLRYWIYEEDEAFRWMYFITNLVLCSGTVLFQRYVFVIFGGAGVCSSIVNFLMTEATVEQNAWFSVIFGILLISFGIYVQKKTPTSNFPFWVFLYGSTVFFGGMSTLYGYPIYTSQMFKFFFLLTNVGLCLLTLYTQYRIFIIYGVIGGIWCILDIVRQHQNSWWVPFVLTAIGLAIIALAIYVSHQGMKKRRALKEQKEQKQQEIEMQSSFFVRWNFV